MTKRILLAAAGIALAGGIFYFSRTVNHSPVASREIQGVIAVPPSLNTVCVEHIQNLSGKPVNMDGVDQELVAQLRKVGFPSPRTVADDTGPRCDATVNAELVELSGRGSKTARIDFRLTLRGEEPPRISASVTGKSANNRIAKFASGFLPAESVKQNPKSDEELAARDAVIAAIEQQATRIRSAYLLGLPPWLPESGKGQ